MLRFLPQTRAEVAAFVAEAAESRTPLSIEGNGSKRGLGRPVEAVNCLDLSRISGISFYEPGDLVLCAQAGTPIDEIDALLAAQGQELAFEPMSGTALYGTGAGTIGGAYMTNLSGPRRIKAGALRDFVLGVEAVSGRGEIFKAGGRVVKNVTGYDLARGLSGSFGTLVVATSVTLKVLPRAETAVTLLVETAEPERGIAALCNAMGLPVDVSGAAYLPGPQARRLGFPKPVAALRLEGFESAVAARLDRLARDLAPFGASEKLERQASLDLWRAIRDVTPLAEPREHLVWKISVAPQAGPGVGETLARQHSCEMLYDWSGGLIWLAMEPSPGAGAKAVREAVARAGGGHATLFRAPPQTRSEIAVFEPPSRGLAALSNRLKAQFDPLELLEPGRLWAEM
jgi:glycolate oxidase FAD binding subunit